MEKIKVGVLGATGIVGQNYIKLLQNHPWFEVADLAASPESADKPYAEVAKQKWQLSVPVPENVKNVKVRDANKVEKIPSDISFVFSAIELPKKEDIKALEFKYAEQGIPVVSNNSAARWIADVPMLIPEINADHINVIPLQQKNHNLPSGGFVVVKPNCSVQSYLTPIYALEKKGFKVEKMIITTLQAVSGAGYPGVASLDIVDNIIPFISGEDEKSEQEPLKILGKLSDKGIENYQGMVISATCTRVPVIDGHTACVSMKFKDKVPTIDEIKAIWKDFKSVPQELNLPFAPKQPLIYLEDENRPQPRKDRDTDKGMAVSIGRLRKDPVFDWKFVGLSHNTVRGAAGGGILNAELLYAKSFIKAKK
jgi:aspartate-semialdehyde dehydrogenase